MKRQELLDTLTLIKPCIRKNSILPHLSNRVSFKNSSIEAFNGIGMGMSVEFDSGLDFSVNGVDLIKIISSLKDEDIEMKLNEQTLVIKSKKSVYNLVTEKSSDHFPPSEEGIEYIKAPSTFVNGLKICLRFANNDANRERQYGVTVNENFLYSTNEIGVSSFELPETTKIKHILSESFINIISSLDGELLIGSSDKAVFVKNDKVRTFTGVNEIELLDYASILERYDIKGLESFLVEISEEFRNTIGRLISLGIKEIIVASKLGNCVLQSNTDFIKAREEVDMPFMTGDFIARFNAPLLHKLVKTCSKITAIILDKDVILVGVDEGFYCLVANIM